MATAAKKVYLISPQQLEEQLRRHQNVTDNPTTAVKLDLDIEMEKILQQTSMPLFTKIQLYNQALQKYLNIHAPPREDRAGVSTNLTEPAEDSSDNRLPLEDTIINSTTKGQRWKAKLLIQQLRQHKRTLTWDEKG